MAPSFRDTFGQRSKADRDYEEQKPVNESDRIETVGAQASQIGPCRATFRLTKFCNDLDQPDNIAVEFRKFICWNPKFCVNRRAYLLHGIAEGKLCTDLEASHESGPALSHIPIAGNLSRVLLIGDRIEYWLPRQTRWKFLPT
jgi:hypothetical protein